MGSKKLRITAALVPLVLLALGAVTVPGAFGQEGLTATFQNQPTDAVKDEVITSVAFDPTAEPISVEVRDSSSNLVPGALVTLSLTEGSPSGATLSGNTATAGVDGTAEFPELSIDKANNPLTTGYQLEATAEPGISLEGFAFVGFSEAPNLSEPFDIWGAGCRSSDGCNLNFTASTGEEELLREDNYSVGANVGLGASEFEATEDEISCLTQRVIYDDVFYYVTPNDADTVFLFTHITRLAMKLAPNNGQKHIGWCVGLKDDAQWVKNGAAFEEQIVGGERLFVALAPKCPRKNPSGFAPCFVSKMSDDNGGSFIRGYLPGGDPPRRT